jgi:hypothetical protein
MCGGRDDPTRALRIGDALARFARRNFARASSK